MSTAQIGYAVATTATKRDRSRSAIVRERQAARRMARAAKHAPTPIDLDVLALELSTAWAEAAR